MPVYKRANGNWIIRFTRSDGSRYQKTYKLKDYPRKRDVQALERDIRAKEKAHQLGEHTVADMMAKYWEEHGRYLQWARSVAQHLERMSDDFGDKTPLASITTSRISDAAAKWRVTPVYNRSRGKVVIDSKTGKPKLPSVATINRRLAVLRSAMKMAYETWEWRDTPIVAWKRLMRAEPETIERDLSNAARERLLAACPPWLAAIVEFAIATGLRQGPILALQWQDIDADSRLIVPVGKGRKSNPVELTDWAWEVLERIGRRNIGPVFTRNGKRIKSLKTAWEFARKRAELPDVRFHDLRHTFGQMLMDETGDLTLVQDALHHASPTTTRRYAHRRRAHVRQAAEKAQAKRKA